MISASNALKTSLNMIVSVFSFYYHVLKFCSKDVALLSLIVILLQSSSFVFAWLCIVLRCWLLLSLLFG